MDPKGLLSVLHTAEKLKDAARHCETSGGRRESVAEHSWRLALMAYLCRDEFPEADMDRVLRMCLIHDLGEAFTGDIPSFAKTPADERREEALLGSWVSSLPQPYRGEMTALYAEMAAQETPEARIYKALDGMEALVQHNESSLDSWSENEYDLNLHYADDRAAFSPYLKRLRQDIRDDTSRKLVAAGRTVREKSCGAVLYAAAPEGRLYLVEHMIQGHYSLCKGHVERGETERETAEREVLEETGLSVTVDPAFRETIEYSPRMGVYKTVVFFAARASRTETVPQPEEVTEIRWLPLDRALRLLSFESDRNVLRRADAYLNMKEKADG